MSPKDVVREFIELYRKKPCLWKVKSEDYKNRNLKNAAYEELLDLLLTVEQDATVETVKKKINSLRTCYRKELKKVLHSIRLGCRPEDVYQPLLWYFPLLDFLRDQETPRQGNSNIDELGLTGDAVDPLGDNDEEEDIDASICLDKDYAQSQWPRSRAGSSTSFGSQSSDKGPNRSACKRSRGEDKANELMRAACQRLASIKEDEFTCVGNNVANKLRKVNRRQRIFAEKLINDVLFAAQLNALTTHSSMYADIPDNPAIDSDG